MAQRRVKATGEVTQVYNKSWTWFLRTGSADKVVLGAGSYETESAAERAMVRWAKRFDITLEEKK